MPYINFMNYYYFGQTKYGTDNQNLFSDSWGVTEAWRAFPSAETIGEFFALAVFYHSYTKNSKFHYLLIVSALLAFWLQITKQL